MIGDRGDVIMQVIPSLSGDATEQTPPDLPSYLFKEQIVYLGMSLVPAVTELMLAELLYLQYDNPNKPIYMYINSTGVAVRVRSRCVVEEDCLLFGMVCLYGLLCCREEVISWGMKLKHLLFMIQCDILSLLCIPCVWEMRLAKLPCCWLREKRCAESDVCVANWWILGRL